MLAKGSNALRVLNSLEIMDLQRLEVSQLIAGAVLGLGTAPSAVS